MRPTMRMTAAMCATAAILFLSGCVPIQVVEEQTIARVESDLKLDDLGGARCATWHKPGFLDVGDSRRLTFLIDDAANYAEVNRRLENIGFEERVIGSTTAEFVRNDIPEPGDYVGATVVQHPDSEAGEQMLWSKESCTVADAGSVEVEIFI